MLLGDGIVLTGPMLRRESDRGQGPWESGSWLW
jgi:hypothetical protein